MDVTGFDPILQRVQVQSLLWSLPLISNTDVPTALGISQTTWQQMKLDGNAPPAVSIGRRVFYRPHDLREWVAEQETKKNPGEDAGVLEERVG